MKSRWLHLLITIFIIFSYMQFEYVRYCMECDAGYQEYSYANAVINIVGDRYLILPKSWLPVAITSHFAAAIHLTG